jgi:acyl-CoA synthetase (AMP-forming)/AMP-acid ligase II/acyl carrier protein
MHASTIPDMISATRGRFPDKIALEDGEESVCLTYSEIEHGSDLWSRSLSTIVPSGERIAVMMEGGVTLSRWILAIMWRHAVVPLRPDLSTDDVRRYLEVTRTRFLITPSASESLVRLCGDIGVTVLTPDSVTDLEPRSPGELEFPTDASVVVVLLTSGSTGRPKVVPLTHKNLLTSTHDMARALDLSESDRCLVQWSQYHIGGLIDHLLVPLSTGGTIINGGSFSLDAMTRLIKTARPTWTQFVPATLDETLRDSERQSEPLIPNTLRFIRCVAAPMNEDLWERAERALGCPLLHAYGMTEASPLVTATPLGLAERARGSTGRSVGPEIRVVDENDQPVAPGIEGAIQVRGANVFDGYEGEPELNQATFVDGWFRTGDLGYLDANGELFVRGREKNMINRGGEKINPTEVEEVLRRHPSVSDVSVFGLPHRRLGQIVAAAVTVTQRVESDALLAFAADTLSSHKVPAQILILDELPRLGVGKVDLSRLVEMSMSQLTQHSHTYRSVTEELIATIWADELGAESLSPDVPFTVAGGDSLSAIRVVAEVERAFDVRGSSDELLRSRTIREMSATVESLRGRDDPPPATATTWRPTRTRWNNSLGVDDFANRIALARTDIDLQVEQQMALTHLSAHEIDELIDMLDQRQFDVPTVCPMLIDSRPTHDRTHSPSIWLRGTLHEYVSIYSRQNRSPASTTLLAFGSNAYRMMLPLHQFLSCLPHSIGTFVLVIDPTRTFFANGVPGIAPDISSLASGLSNIIPPELTGNIRTIGTSAGATPAAIVGIEMASLSLALVGADALSHNPGMERALRNLMTTNERKFNCRLVCGLMRRDLLGLGQIRRIIPGSKSRVFLTRDHNVMGHAWNRGRLPDLLDWLLFER